MPHNPKVRTAATTRIAPALPRRAPSRVGRLYFFANSGSTSRLLYAKPAAPTQLDENEHDDPHVLFESHAVITTDIDPIDSQARGAVKDANSPKNKNKHTTPTERKRAHPSADRHSAALVVLFQDRTKKIGRD